MSALVPPGGPVPSLDRKLGDEWEDWDGTAQVADATTPMRVFLGLAGLVVLGLLGLAGLGLWLIAPRLQQFGVQGLVQYLAWGLMIYAVSWYAALWAGTGGVRPLRRVVAGLGGIRWMVGPAVWLGRRLGVSRDRIGNAFIQVHNRLEVLPAVVSEPARLLVLVPRCLGREQLLGLQALRQRYGFTQVTAIGGTEARRAIAAQRPQGVLAIACERDLLSGIQDLNGRIPVIGLANRRPEGPCKNTQIDLSLVERVIRQLLPQPAPKEEGTHVGQH